MLALKQVFCLNNFPENLKKEWLTDCRPYEKLKSAFKISLKKDKDFISRVVLLCFSLKENEYITDD